MTLVLLVGAVGCGSSSSGGQLGDGASDGADAGNDGGKDATSSDASAGETGDAAPDGKGDVGAGDASAGDASASGCEVGCHAMTGGSWCTNPEVEWVCDGSHDTARMQAGGCQMLPTGAIRYCCPGAFLSQCR